MKKVLVILFCCLFLLEGCSELKGVYNDVSDTLNYSNEENKYYNYAKDIIKKQLMTPATAEFPPISDSEVSLSGAFDGQLDSFSGPNSDAKYVSGYVDYDNLLGARVRAYYSIVFYRNIETGKEEYEIVRLE